MSNKYIHGGFANRALIIMTEMPGFVHLFPFFPSSFLIHFGNQAVESLLLLA